MTRLEIVGLVKHFRHVKANDGIDVEFCSSQIHALLGENGAGKSTLVKILAGIYQPTAGTIRIDGEPITLDSPLRAREHAIAVVHQQSMLVPRLNVLENVALQEGGLGRVDRSLGERLVESGERLGFQLEPTTSVERLTLGERQRVEIARALMVESRFVVLDEPTVALSPAERDDFYDLLARLAGEGVGVVLVTHHLKEAVTHSHRLTILRFGKVVGRADDPSQIGERELARTMVGNVEFRAKRPAEALGDEMLRVEGLSGTYPGGRTLDNISLSVRAGEVMGIAGVEGNGQRELAAALTGAWVPARGTVSVDGKRLRDYSPRRRAQLVADVPDDHALATVDELSIWENIGLDHMAWQEPPTPRTKRSMRRRAAELVREFGIRASSIDTPVGQLSGGNRRRVVLARELSKQPAVVVESFATKGLDVRSQEQVKEWTRELARRGAAVVYISADLEEILDVSDRIAVLARSRITGVFDVADADVRQIGELMLVAASEHEEAVA
jgi:simple sugar transport system ATP-binding protein